MQCPRCHTELAGTAEFRCRVCGTVIKGPLLARLRPPFEPFGPYRNPAFLLGGITVLLFALSLFEGWIELAGYLGSILFVGGLFLLNRTAFMVTSVSVYKNGLEMVIPRSINKSLYLSWDRLTDYRFEGHIFRYKWQADGLIVLAGGRSPSRWPYFFFPNKLKMPDDRTMDLVRSLLPPTARGERPGAPASVGGDSSGVSR
jgi:hypothetical protein